MCSAMNCSKSSCGRAASRRASRAGYGSRLRAVRDQPQRQTAVRGEADESCQWWAAGSRRDRRSDAASARPTAMPRQRRQFSSPLRMLPVAQRDPCRARPTSIAIRCSRRGPGVTRTTTTPPSKSCNACNARVLAGGRRRDPQRTTAGAQAAARPPPCNAIADRASVSVIVAASCAAQSFAARLVNDAQSRKLPCAQWSSISASSLGSACS